MSRKPRKKPTPKKSAKSRSSISLKRRAQIFYSRGTIALKILIVVLLLLFFFTDIFSGVKTYVAGKFYRNSAEQGFMINNVTIQGQTNTPTRSIMEAIHAKKGDPIFSLNLNQIRDNLMNNPWIEDAIVERRLPDTLYIAIFERTPIAIWQFNQKIYLIDSEGRRISKKNIEQFPDLIQVVGEGANIYAQPLMDELATHPELASKVRSAVRFGNRRWNLHFAGGITAKMPENDFAGAYDYLAKLNESGKFDPEKYASFDLRIKDRYYFEKRG